VAFKHRRGLPRNYLLSAPCRRAPCSDLGCEKGSEERRQPKEIRENPGSGNDHTPKPQIAAVLVITTAFVLSESPLNLAGVAFAPLSLAALVRAQVYAKKIAKLNRMRKEQGLGEVPAAISAVALARAGEAQ